MDPRFVHQTYLLRRKVMKLIGGAFHVFDPSGNLVLYAEQKGFKLKEDIRLFGDTEKREELLRIGARRALDISAVYDVTDARTGEPVGALQRKGLKSVVQDEWTLLDPSGAQIGLITEDSMALALVRRFLVNLIPQRFSVQMGGAEVAEFHQNFNPFLLKITLDFSKDPERRLDRRLGLAAGVLLSAIEGRQQ